MAAASSAPPVAALVQVKAKRGRLQGGPTVVHHHHHHHHLPHAQRRMGPAPFASFEDLSDDMDSPSEDKLSGIENKMPGIREDPTPTADLSTSSFGDGPGPSASTLAPTTPRIDISRASSSSHHDSNSSPERELFTADGGTKLGLGFKEEGAADLRSSTEELAYHGESSPKDGRRKSQISQSSQLDPSAAASLSGGGPDRKDSACSDTGLLCISGRTSRLSSVGSASSGRSPSPHKMLLETSFCGSKPIPSRSVDVDSPTRERVILSKETDPTKAVIVCEEASTSQSQPQKPVTLQLHTETRSRPVQSFTQLMKPIVNEPVPEPEVIVVAEISSITTTTTTTSPSPASRKTSLASLASPKTPTGSKRRLTNLLREASEGFKERSRSRSKSRERTASLISGGSTSSTSETKKSDSRKSSTSKGSGGVFGLFKKKKDKPSPQELSATDSSRLDAIEFTFRDAQLLPSESVMLPNLDTERLQTRIIELNPKSGDVTAQIIELKPRSPRSPRSPHQLQGEIIEIESAQIIELKPRTLNEPFKPQVVKLQPKIKPPQEVPTEIVMLTREPYRTGQREFRPETPELETQPIHIDHQTSSPISPIQPPSFATAAIEHHKTPPSLEKEELSLEIATQTDDIETITSAEPLPSTTSVKPVLAPASNNSSDSEADYTNTVPISIKSVLSGKESEVKKIIDPQNEDEELDTERRGLFGQQDSLEDELPFVPTTLPQERTRGICLVPSKQRPTEVKTCPVERPRSCTPIKPALLDEFVQSVGSTTSPGSTTPGHLSGMVGAGIAGSSGGSGSGHSPASDKMRILLPGTDGRLTSGRRQSREPAPTWYEFAERGLQSPREFRRTSSPSPPPPLPPRASTTPQTPPAKAWVNFEELPERKKLPKRIQALPSATSDPPVIYSYVNPEDCKCECHASSRASSRGVCNHTTASSSAPIPAARSSSVQPPPRPAPRSRTSLSLDPPPEKQHSYLSDSSSESPSPYNLEPATSSIGGHNDSLGHKSMKPFGMDLDVSSNRSSIVSQEDNSPELVASPTN